MRRILIFLILAAQAQGALTIASRGVRNNNVSSATWAISPTSTIVVGAMGVVCMALDNPASAGAGKNLSNATINDSVGNVWTRRLNFIYDPGAANAGVEIGVYTGVITTQMLSTDTLTITFGTAVTAKAAAFWQVTAGGGNTVSYVTGAASCDGCTSGQSSTTPTITTGTITVGDVVIGIVGNEGTGAGAVDSDTLNGTWSGSNATGSGGSMAIMTQNKIQTTADSTQTYNTVITSADWETAYIQLREVAPPTPTPTPGPNTGAFLPFFAPGLIWLKSWFL